MNGRKAKALRKISMEIALKEKIDEYSVYQRLKKIALKNKKLKV